MLIVSLALFTCMLFSAEASDIIGGTSLALSGDLTVTTTLTVGSSEGDAPANMYVFVDTGTCPTGWTEVSTYNSRFIMSGATLATGGSNSHVHTAESYTHTVNTIKDNGASVEHDHAQSYCSTSSSVTHLHSMNGCGTDGDGSGSGSQYLIDGSSTNPTAHSHSMTDPDTDLDGGHSHASVTGSLSTASTLTGSSSSVPRYQTLTLCQK